MEAHSALINWGSLLGLKNILTSKYDVVSLSCIMNKSLIVTVFIEKKKHILPNVVKA